MTQNKHSSVKRQYSIDSPYRAGSRTGAPMPMKHKGNVPGQHTMPQGKMGHVYKVPGSKQRAYENSEDMGHC